MQRLQGRREGLQGRREGFQASGDLSVGAIPPVAQISREIVAIIFDAWYDLLSTNVKVIFSMISVAK